MQAKVGLVLLSWSAISAMLAVYAFFLATGFGGVVNKSLTPPAYAIELSGALDEEKLDTECKSEGADPPKRNSAGHIDTFTLVEWLGGGARDLLRQALMPLAFGLAANTLMTAAGGIVCMRKPAPA